MQNDLPISHKDVGTMKSIYTLLFVVSCVVVESRAGPHRSLRPSNDEEPYRIFDSKNATISKYPHTVAILTKYNELLGGGMIYKNQWIITNGRVGNTTIVSNMTVRVGSDDALDGGQLFNVTKVFFPPSFEHCLALIKLNKKIRFSKTAKPIKIAFVSPGAGSIGYVTGYGESKDSTFRLQRKTSTIYDYYTCRNNWWTVGVWMTEYDICAMGSKSCYGDNGDPLVYQGRAVGIFRADPRCIWDFYPTIYCELPKFRKWIDATIWENTQTSFGAQGFGDHKTHDETADDDEQ